MATLHEQAQATPTPAGAATFTFQPVPSGQVWTGSITVPGATPNSVLPIVWTAYDNGQFIGSWFNGQSSGTVQATGTVTVTATSGVASAPIGLVASFFGNSVPTLQAPLWSPSPTPAPPPPSPFTLYASPGAGDVWAGGSKVLLNSAPVQIGGGVLVNAEFINTSGRVQLEWSVPGTFRPVIAMFDVPNTVPLQSWIIQNYGTNLTIRVFGTASNSQVFLTAVTGNFLPGQVPYPTSISPSLTQEPFLLQVSGTLPANGQQGPFTLQPYSGLAYVYLHAFQQGGAPQVNSVEVQISSQDYLAANVDTANIICRQTGINDIFTIPADAPMLPPLINSCIIYNLGNAFTVGYRLTIAPMTLGAGSNFS